MTKLRAKLTAMLTKRKAAVTNLEARIAALDAGQRKYHSESCCHGHDGAHYTSSGSCVECIQEASNKWR